MLALIIEARAGAESCVRSDRFKRCMQMPPEGKKKRWRIRLHRPFFENRKKKASNPARRITLHQRLMSE